MITARWLVPLAGSFSACSARYNVRDDSSKRLLNVRNHFQRRVLGPMLMLIVGPVQRTMRPKTAAERSGSHAGPDCGY